MLFLSTCMLLPIVLCQSGTLDEKFIIVTSAERQIDVSSQMAKYTTEIELKNDGNEQVNQLIYVLSAKEDEHLAFIGAIADNTETPLIVTRKKSVNLHFALYSIELLSPIDAKAKGKVKIEVILVHYLNPHPTHILQSEQQFVIYEGNAYILSSYAIDKQKTTINLYPGHVESFTKIEPSKHEGNKIVYGSYEGVAAYSQKAVQVHFENNSPFLSITSMERVLEVSHWGNVAIEEHFSIVHNGAILKGSFSRLDFQMDRRGNKRPVVESFKTILPATAKDVYYRDEIGNISTSHLRQTGDSVEIEIQPRFPLFGGWKSNYVLGYNVPSYEYLYSTGSNLALKMRLQMRFLDHVFDNMVVDKLTVKVILPEGARKIKLNPPYTVRRSPDELHYTYLDTTGRPVVIAHKDRLVDAHIQEFTLHYEFDRLNMWREPLLAIIAFYVLFLTVIIYVRLDFSISEDAISESRMKVQGLVDQLTDLHAQRLTVYDQQVELINTFKRIKEVAVLTSSRKKIDLDLKNLATQMTDLQGETKSMNPEMADKLSELQKGDKTARELLGGFQQQIERLVAGKLPKSQLADVEKAFKMKMDEIKEKMDQVVYGL